MTDLLDTFRVRRNVVTFWLRNVKHAQAQLQRWPGTAQDRHVACCRHELAEAMHRYCGHPKPEPLPPVDPAQAQREYIELVMSIPLHGSRAA